MLSKRELAEKMLEWGELDDKMRALAAEIEEAVLEIGKTQVVGDVRATFSGGRGSTDYEKAYNESGIKAPAAVLAQRSNVVYDYKGLCEDLEIKTDRYYTPGNKPTVTLKRD